MELRPEEEYTLLHNLETKLRMLIETKLSILSDYWWQDCVPMTVRNTVSKRIRNKRLAPWFNVGAYVKLPEMYYLGVEDYSKIITQLGNWKRVFENIFRDQDFITRRLSIIKEVRNKVMHFQPLEPDEKRLLEQYVHEILTRIGNWEMINGRYVDVAQEHLLRGEFNEAAQILNQILRQTINEENPRGDPWAAFWMGSTLEELGKCDEAETLYRYSIERLLPRYRKMAEQKLHNIDRKKQAREIACPNCGHCFALST